MVILIGTWRVRKTRTPPEAAEGTTATEINLSRAQSVDIAYLTIASLYGLTLFLKDELSLFDAVVLITIYVLYLRRLSGAPAHEPHLVGPSAYIGSLPRRTRRIINYAMFVVSAGVILLCAEAFADSIIELGEAIGVSDFLLIKWIAPTASEAPELLVATLFAWRLASRTGLGALISSKVNQWTLLVGTLPIVFSIFAGVLHGLPLGTGQRIELRHRRTIRLCRSHRRQPHREQDRGVGDVGSLRGPDRRIIDYRARAHHRGCLASGAHRGRDRVPNRRGLGAA